MLQSEPNLAAFLVRSGIHEPSDLNQVRLLISLITHLTLQLMMVSTILAHGYMVLCVTKQTADLYGV